MTAWVYILASRPYETLYTGLTTDLVRRVYEHREGLIDGFSEKYGTKTLVWYENHIEIAAAIKREKQIKRWRRRWKFELIEKLNPEWDDLYLALNRQDRVCFGLIANAACDMPQGLAHFEFLRLSDPGSSLRCVRDDGSRFNLTIVIPAKRSAEPGPESRGVRPLLTGNR